MSKEAFRSRLVAAASYAAPPLARLRADRDHYARECARLQRELDDLTAAASVAAARGTDELYPRGHFYSPLPDLDEVRRAEAQLFAAPEALPGIDLRAADQLARLETMAPLWAAWPYYDDAEPGPGPARRYRPDNDYFGHTDALLLYGMLVSQQPKRYVEIGSGWSSALVLDTRERAFDNDLECTFIEPYPDRLCALLTDADRSTVRVIERPAQAVDLGTFEALESGDFLFIDSSHVSKLGSDVNALFFDVLPRVRPGVWLHVHDVGYPFEYPSDWIYEGRAWNEAYLLRALLIENPHWEIAIWADYLKRKHPAALQHSVPNGARLDGVSLWLRRR